VGIRVDAPARKPKAMSPSQALRKPLLVPASFLVVFLLSVLPAALGQTPLECGRPIQDSIANPVDRAFYAFGALAGDAITLRLVVTSGSLYALLELYSPTGTRVGYSSSYSTPTVNATFSAAGIYTVIVSDANRTATGNYSLVWQKLNGPCNPSTISCGQPVAGSLTGAAQLNVYTFTANAGDKITLRLAVTSGSFYALLELYSPAGTSLGSSWSYYTPTVDATLSTAGTHTVIVSDGNRRATGNYSLVWQKLNGPCNHSTISCGQPITGSLSAAAQLNVYTFTGNVGDKITLRLAVTAGSFYALLELYSPTGTNVGYSSSYYTPSVNATLSAAGIYTVIVSDGNRSATGNYSLVWQKLNGPCNPSTISCGQPITGSLSAAAQLNVYTFTGNVGDKITLRLAVTAGSFYALLELYSPMGTSLGSDSDYYTSTVDATLTTAGTHTVIVSDGNRTRSGTYTLVWQMATGPCQPAPFSFTASPTTLGFSASAGSTLPAPQQLELRSTFPGLPWQATVRTRSGGSWLTASPSFGQMPAAVLIYADPTSVAAGNYEGSIEITATGATPPSVTITVTFTVGSGQAANLSVNPSDLSFRAVSGASVPAQSLRLANSGTGTLSWTALAAAASGNWLLVSPSSGTASANVPATLQVSVNAAGLTVGSYSGAIIVRTPETNQSVAVAVNVLVGASEGVLLLSQNSLLFHAVEGGGAEPPQTFGVLNVGSGALDWAAQAVVLEKVNWLRLSSASGRSNAGSAQIPLVSVSMDPTGLSAGLYIGLIRVTSSGANNSPQALRVDLQVLPKGSRLAAVVRPTGLIFVAAAGGAAPSTQDVSIATPETAPVEFISAPVGGDWVNRTPDTSTATRDTPGRITVQAKLGSLAAGIYRAGLTILTRNDGNLYPVNLLFLVLPPGATTSARPATSDMVSPPVSFAGCSPSQLLLQFSSIFARFNATMGWPTEVLVEARDDCGNPAVGGTMVLSFSSGDPALPLTELNNGRYHGSWRPNSLNAEVLVTAQGLWRGLQGRATATALIGANPNPRAVILSQGGVVLGAGFERGPVAPGSIISLFGQNLTTSAATAQTLPLPRTLNGVRVLVGEKEAPLFYVGPSQVNAQVPAEMEADRQLQVRIEVNGVSSAPEPLQTAAARPGIFTLGPPYGNQGAILIANSNKLAMAATANIPSQPAAAGGIISIFCTGLGATEPAVASGQPGPSAEPLARVKTLPTVTIGGKPAAVSFAGMAPGFAAVYQVNAQVPAGVTAGNAVPVVITHGGFSSNTATIAVR